MNPLFSIDQLAEQIAERLLRAIPLSVALWDADTIAAFLQVSPRHVGERLTFLPDFPKPIRLPNITGGSRHRRWKAAEVIAWADKHQEK